MRIALGNALVGIALLLPGGFTGAEVALPELPRGKGENCVEPTEIMRKFHMDFLNHQRDLTVHKGIRTTRHSLVGCVQCHAQQDAGGGFISINAPGQFCQSCHAFTGVKIDCFECHASRPDSSAHSEREPTGESARESAWSFLQIFRGGAAQ